MTAKQTVRDMASSLDKPLSPVSQALVISGLGLALVLFQELFEDTYVLRAFPMISIRLVGGLIMAFGAYRLVRALLSRPPPRA